MRLFFILLFAFILAQNGWSQVCYNPDVNGDNFITIVDLLPILGEYGNEFYISDTCDTEINSCDNLNYVQYHGKAYDIVSIGTQCWFAENLQTDKYSNGNLIPYVFFDTAWEEATSGAYCIWGNDENYSDPYGYIYNGYAIQSTENICPVGWHVPSDVDWIILEEFIGIQESYLYLEYEWRGTLQGEELKSESLWNGSNYYGFNLSPGVNRSNTGAWYPNPQPTGYNTSFNEAILPSTVNDNGLSYSRVWQTEDTRIYRFPLTATHFLKAGRNVRCIKD